MSGQRQAALALHALMPADRDLILAELDRDQQGVLRGLLAELSELGFDPQLDDAARSAPVVAPDPATAPASPSPRHTVEKASASDMLAVVGQEPASFIAALLAAGPWPWADEFLRSLAATRRLAVSSAMAVPMHASGQRDHILIELVARELAGLAPAAAPGPVSGAATLFARMRAWIR